eukprot:2924474-Alexandrium_andersonii.AAC.1
MRWRPGASLRLSHPALHRAAHRTRQMVRNNIGATAQKTAENCWKLGSARFLQFPAVSCATSPGGLPPPLPPKKAPQ